YCYDAVVGVPYKMQSSCFKFSVEFVEHYIAEYWRKISSLRSSFKRILIFSLNHDASLKVSGYKRFGIGVLDDFSDQGHQLILRDIVKELLQVNIHDVGIPIVKVFQQFNDCLLCFSSRSETVASFTEI